jgi:glutamate racemase
VALPNEDFLYLGDTARFPYGDRTAEELETFASEIAAELVRRGAKLLVVACNSASGPALPALRRRFEDELGIDVISVVSPESQAAVVATHSGRIGVLATPATVANGAYERALQAADPHVRVVPVACPDLAPMIQGGSPFDRRMVDTVRAYCEPLREARVDTVILGCTHYPLVRPMLQRILGPRVTLITSGGAIARRVECALEARDLATPEAGEGDYRFLCTGDPRAFQALATRFLQLPLGTVDRVAASTEPALAGVAR